MRSIPLTVLVEARDMLAEVNRLQPGQAIDLQLWIRLNRVRSSMHVEVDLILEQQKIEVAGSTA